MGFRRLVSELGGDPALILRGAGLDPGSLDDPDRYLPYRNVLFAIAEAARSLNVPDFGLRLAARQDLTFLGMLALAIQSAGSVRQGLVFAARHFHFHTPALEISFGEPDAAGHERIALRFLLKDLPFMPQAVEHAVGMTSKAVLLLSQGAISPAEIHFRHRRIGKEWDYIRHLGQLPVFEAEFDGIVMDGAESRRRLPGTNHQLQGFVERFLIGVAPPPDLAPAAQVREVLRSLIRVQHVQLADVARVLRIHPRTLQRQLKLSGAKFESLLDEIRRETTEQMLRDSQVPLAIVARNAGFTDQPALNRACRRWFDKTPGAIRRQREALTFEPVSDDGRMNHSEEVIRS